MSRPQADSLSISTSLTHLVSGAFEAKHHYIGALLVLSHRKRFLRARAFNATIALVWFGEI